MRVSKSHGRSIQFNNGFQIGFTWMNWGRSPRNSAVIAAYHPTKSITWRWALYWNKPRDGFHWPEFYIRNREYGQASVRLPFVGALSFKWQPYMWVDKA